MVDSASSASMLLIDGHNDLPWALRTLDGPEPDLAVGAPGLHTDLPRLRAGGVGAQFWSVFVPCSYTGDAAVAAVVEQVERVHALADRYPADLRVVTTADEVEAAYADGWIGSLLGAEGGHSIGGSLQVLRALRRSGVRYMTLTHNLNTEWADSATDTPAHDGLTDFGVSVVEEMNQLGMMIGVSHLSANGVLHVADISKHPIVSTHQNLERFVKSRPLVEIMDEEAKAIAKTGGIVGIRYIPEVTPYKLLADEVEYLAKLIGVEHIGVGWLGHDKVNPVRFEIEGHGAKPGTGVEAQTIGEHYATFIKMLSERGFSDDHIGLILGGNYLRIWRQILPAA